MQHWAPIGPMFVHWVMGGHSKFVINGQKMTYVSRIWVNNALINAERIFFIIGSIGANPLTECNVWLNWGSAPLRNYSRDNVGLAALADLISNWPIPLSREVQSCFARWITTNPPRHPQRTELSASTCAMHTSAPVKIPGCGQLCCLLS